MWISKIAVEVHFCTNTLHALAKYMLNTVMFSMQNDKIVSLHKQKNE